MMANKEYPFSQLGSSDQMKDSVRMILENAAQSIMEMETAAICGAALGSRSQERLNRRNGYRDRTWDTRVGSIDLQIPKLRHGSYFPSFLEPRRRTEKALMAAIQEAYLQGVSTRAVDES